jgi:glycosyltransferase involved in cell wall biosynthesis
VFIEWCSAHSVLLNLIDPGKARVIVRLHSYEAFTPWPHLLDFSRVDDMVFVSAHVRDLVETAVPGLAEGPASKLHVLPLGLRLGRYVKPKSENARFTLGLVGWRQVAKDPLWALQVVRRLRETDERFRLVLVGDPFEAEVSAATRAYGSRLDAELAELVAAGAVQQWGRTNDIPGALTEIGVILSSSVRESFHAGLVEGAASGAVPVVRHWPFFAGRRNGARTLFPAEWVVDTPEQAAARILETTHDSDDWRRTGQAASEHALATWEWDVVKEGYDRLLSC